MLRNGFDGAKTMSSAAAIASSTSGVGDGDPRARVPQRGHRVRVVPMDEVLLELEPAVRGQQLGPDTRLRSSAAGARRTPERSGEAGRHLGQTLRPRAGARCARG